MSTSIRYLSALGIALALVLAVGIPIGMAADDGTFGATRVNHDMDLWSRGPNGFGFDHAYTSVNGRDLDTIPKSAVEANSWGVGVCGMIGRCRPGH